MRTTLLALVMILGIAATASAQALLQVVVSDGVLTAKMPAAVVPHATGWPMATVPARALKAGVDPTVPEFRVRSWEEADGVRVVVFAVMVSEPRREVREEQIASVFVPVDQFVEVPATEKYRARRLTLSAYRIPTRRWRSSPLEAPKIDVPVRPWTPPPH